jgi:hypothetical protein
MKDEIEMSRKQLAKRSQTKEAYQEGQRSQELGWAVGTNIMI